MTELDIAGVGIWSSVCSNWQTFCDGIENGNWQSDVPLMPGLIPPRERRRAPQSVKMAVEVLDQACTMASLDPATAAVVFSSAMGDMQITDYLCGVLAEPPRLVSPIRFHNSVHNATTGYWSIARDTHAPTSAVSALSFTAPMAFLEAAIQVAEEDLPVLLVCQEMAAPKVLHSICQSDNPLSLSMALTKPGFCADPLASIRFDVEHKKVDWPALPHQLDVLFKGNPAAHILPLIAAIAGQGYTGTRKEASFKFPLSEGASLNITLIPGKPQKS